MLGDKTLSGEALRALALGTELSVFPSGWTHINTISTRPCYFSLRRRGTTWNVHFQHGGESRARLYTTECSHRRIVDASFHFLSSIGFRSVPLPLRRILIIMLTKWQMTFHCAKRTGCNDVYGSFPPHTFPSKTIGTTRPSRQFAPYINDIWVRDQKPEMRYRLLFPGRSRNLLYQTGLFLGERKYRDRHVSMLFQGFTAESFSYCLSRGGFHPIKVWRLTWPV